LLDWLQNSPATAQKFNLISPVIFLGGTALATVLNLPLRFKAHPGHFISFSYSRLSKINVVVACVGALLLSVLMLYLLLENL
jgi:hypothetical protein